jgi:hypothetical protein
LPQALAEEGAPHTPPAVGGACGVRNVRRSDFLLGEVGKTKSMFRRMALITGVRIARYVCGGMLLADLKILFTWHWDEESSKEALGAIDQTQVMDSIKTLG